MIDMSMKYYNIIFATGWQHDEVGLNCFFLLTLFKYINVIDLHHTAEKFKIHTAAIFDQILSFYCRRPL